MADPITYRIDEIESAIVTRILEYVTYLNSSHIYKRAGKVGPDFIKELIKRTPAVLLVYSGSTYGDVYTYDDYNARLETLSFSLFLVSMHLRGESMRTAGWDVASGLTKPLSIKRAGTYDLVYDVGASLEMNKFGLLLQQPFHINTVELALSTPQVVMYRMDGDLSYERAFPSSGTC